MTTTTSTTENNVFIPGELEVKLVPYKNKDGGFKVGTLRLPMCEAEVKDSWIENFDLGTYSGSFLLQKIAIKTIPTRKGGVFSVLQAEVPQYAIEDIRDDSEQAFQEDLPERADPAEEEQSPALPEKASQSPAQGDVPKTPENNPDKGIQSVLDEEALSVLEQVAGVKSLAELPDQVDVDQTLPRAVLRKFYNLININKGGTHKFVPEAKAWVRQA